MNSTQAYDILREIIRAMAARGERVKELPPEPLPDLPLEASGIDLITFSEIAEDLKQRFQGKDFNLEQFLVPEEFHYLTMGKLLAQITSPPRTNVRNPQVVYVDDEEENLFIFKRKFGNKLNLKTFTDPIAALAYIKTEESVALVITDEVMPLMGGNALCDEVHKAKPMMKFVLITGNPNSDDDLLYRSLRQSRFFEFLNKPLDLEGKGEEYLAMFRGILNSGG
jgi:CheY-like chemotaxis protein